jgi:MYXO-CTERM domain-containing protein
MGLGTRGRGFGAHHEEAMRNLVLLPLFALTVAAPAFAQDGGTDGGTTPATDAGTPANDAGTPADDAGTPANDAGTPADDAGVNDDAGVVEPEACDPDTFVASCTGDVVNLCNPQTNTTAEVDCSTLVQNIENATGLDANLTCGSIGCVENDENTDCSFLQEANCIGGADGLCQILNFDSPANLGGLTYCETGASCAVTVTALPVGAPQNEQEVEFINACFPSFGSCMPGQTGGPCADMGADGTVDTMTFCSNIGDGMGGDLGTIPDISGFRCTSFQGGACAEDGSGNSTCTFSDQLCFNNGGLYGCDTDGDGTINGGCDFGATLPDPWGDGDDTIPDNFGTCQDVDASCTPPADLDPTDPDGSYPDACNGDFLITECHEYVGQGFGYNCARIDGATCGQRDGDTEDVCIIPEGGPCSNTRPLKCDDGLFCNGTGVCQAQSGGDGDGDGDGDTGDGDGDGDTDGGPDGDMTGGCGCNASGESNSSAAGGFALVLGLGVAFARRRRD